jgi:hypothetical protein
MSAFGWVLVGEIPTKMGLSARNGGKQGCLSGFKKKQISLTLLPCHEKVTL